MAGSSRIAMRPGERRIFDKDGTLYYLLSDQLGSTSITTDSTGAKVSELRYKPCPLRFAPGVLREGEERFTDGVTPTDYTYTGQYSNMSDDVKLLFYNARWYDPALGRFAQADTVVPDGVQGWDRYAYTNNNPVTYNDPSGHCIWDLCIVEGIGVVELTIVAAAAFGIAEFYANTPPPPALTQALDSADEAITSTIAEMVDELNNKVKGEYFPEGLGKYRGSYHDAVERYKKSHHIPPNVNVPPEILDGIADAVKRGVKPEDAADDAPEPPEILHEKGKPRGKAEAE